MSRKRSKRRRRRRRRIFLVAVLLAILIAVPSLGFPLNTVIVSGNLHNQPEEITELLLERPIFGNTLLAKLLTTHRKIEEYGFVEEIHAEILTRDTIRITVTERSFIGCVEAEGAWWYFDSAGTVMARAESRQEGESTVPVEGLSLVQSPELGGILPITNGKVFSMLGVLTNLVETEELTIPDRAEFDEDGTMTLYYGEVEVLLGSGEKLDLRLRKLEEVLPTISDGTYAGTLHLETYDGSQSGLIFDKNEG